MRKAERQPAPIDVDGTPAPTSGEKKEGFDRTYKGTCGYHPLAVSLADTQEVPFARNRTGSRPSHDGATAEMDAAVRLVREGGLARARLRGDADFSLTAHFDGWTAEGAEFVFGVDAGPDLVARADGLAEDAWKPPVWEREAPAGPPRALRENVEDAKVRDRDDRTLTT